MAARRGSSVAIFVLSLLLCSAVLSAEPPTSGFTLSLIPRDSINSHIFYSDDGSQFTQIQAAISRSIVRANQISSLGFGKLSAHEQVNNIFAVSGEYLMNISIGTPPIPILAIAATGSDLTWIRCNPSVFDSTKSSTYKPISCSTPPCNTRSIGFFPSCDTTQKCQYSINNGDQSTGMIATETVTLGTSEFHNIVFGCRFDNQGAYIVPGSGKIGLGHGPNSLITQIDKSSGGKFSYCLSDKGSKTSIINFGQNADVSGSDVVSTPLVTKSPQSFYWITLEAITIDKIRVPFFASAGNGGASDSKGNFIIDSGTPLLALPNDFYVTVEALISKQVKAKRRFMSQLGLCFEESGFVAPEIVMNFEGADVTLNDFNIFLTVDEGVICFAAIPSQNFGIYGIMAQMNFMVGIDKVKKSVSFKPADCSSPLA